MKKPKFLPFLLRSAWVFFVFISCSPLANQPQTAPTSTAVQAVSSKVQETTFPSAQTGVGNPTVRFTLKTGGKDGKMVFLGVGGELEGQANPNLTVNPGDVVEITLENGDGIQHDLTLPDFQVATERVDKKGDSAKLFFKADKEGVFAYFCSLPGHRGAGMEGSLIVGKAPVLVEKQYLSISRPPTDLPGPLSRNTPAKVRVDLETIEVQGRLADGTGYSYYTFNGKVPGPFLRVRVGDTVEVHLKNQAGSSMAHSVDFHAVTGPGGGSVMTQTKPGEESSLPSKPSTPACSSTTAPPPWSPSTSPTACTG